MKNSKLSELFPDGLVPCGITPYVHKGKWAVHELLPILLGETGKAEVRIATFNISEDSLRQLFFLLESGKMSALKLLLDMNVKRHKIELLLFAASITPHIRLSCTHMKVMLAANERCHAGIVGSANLNNNPRYEAGVAFTGGKLYDFFVQAFDEIYANDSIPFEWN